MKNSEKIEKRLSSAIGQMIPEDLYGQIAQNIAQEERTIRMNTNATTRTPSKKPFARWIGFAAAACILLACGLFGGRYYLNNIAVDSIVDIDVNPGIEISANKNNKVLQVAAINADAERVLDGMDLKNTDLKVALNALIGSMAKNGYLIDGSNTILVTVQNKNAQHAAQVCSLVVSDIDASLQNNNLTATVVHQTVARDAAAETFAKEQGVSFGKAAFILNLCAKDASLDSAALSKMSLREIAVLVEEKKIDIRDIVDFDADDSVGENIEDAVEDLNENDLDDDKDDLDDLNDPHDDKDDLDDLNDPDDKDDLDDLNDPDDKDDLDDLNDPHDDKDDLDDLNDPDDDKDDLDDRDDPDDD